MLYSRVINLLGLTLSLCTFIACSNGSGPEAAQVGKPIITKVTKESFINGRQFCERYKKITGNEQGVWVDVPRNYDHPEQGNLKIYAYTISKFDPSKPSYIFVDGGPGQNTHGVMKEYLSGAVNEIRFDQRGLGCSTPETWDLYRTSSLYSTENTIRDMEEIRKKYGISRWSVYGLSYGTVPATEYGSKYPNSTTSVVLEGVVDNSGYLHVDEYKAEKLNAMLNQLNSAQRSSFSDLILEDSKDSTFLVGLILSAFYSDAGMRQVADLMKVLIEQDGKIRRDYINKIRVKSAEQDMDDNKEYDAILPQRPGAVDENILVTIYCRELDYRTTDSTSLDYRRYSGFVVTASSHRTHDKDCDEMNIRSTESKSYNARNYPITVPVYYFQGSHDGATLAKGAAEHWSVVPKAKSYFMLAQKGGHNPNLSRLSSDSYGIKTGEAMLFRKAVLANDITQSDVDSANSSQQYDRKWLLFLNGPNEVANGKILAEQQGIKVIDQTISLYENKSASNE